MGGLLREDVERRSLSRREIAPRHDARRARRCVSARLAIFTESVGGRPQGRAQEVGLARHRRKPQR